MMTLLPEPHTIVFARRVKKMYNLPEYTKIKFSLQCSQYTRKTKYRQSPFRIFFSFGFCGLESLVNRTSKLSSLPNFYFGSYTIRLATTVSEFQ